MQRVQCPNTLTINDVCFHCTKEKGHSSTCWVGLPSTDSDAEIAVIWGKKTDDLFTAVKGENIKRVKSSSKTLDFIFMLDDALIDLYQRVFRRKKHVLSKDELKELFKVDSGEK